MLPPMLDHIAQAKDQFVRHFGREGKIHVIRAPGRVNLIGEHTDYNEGFVCPMAIEPQVLMVCRARSDGQVVVRSTAVPETLQPDTPLRFSVDSAIEKAPKGDFGNYVRGPAAMLRAKGIPLEGMDCLVTNTLPTGSGLSSSAAMEVGTMLALLTISGNDMAPEEMAQLCQKAEHDYAGMPCGIMDQSIVAGGQSGHAMLLDCRDLSRRFIPVDPNYLRVVIINSNFKHQLVGSEYADRVAECQQAVAYFRQHNPAVTSLRDVTVPRVQEAEQKLDPVVFKRARHVVTENDRCQRFAELLTRQEFEQAGQLMLQSHESLSRDYDVSTEQLDFLVESAMKQRGVYGSRMTGAGFGGCTVSLVQPRFVEQFAEQVRSAYMKQFDITPEVIVTTATAGASVIE